MYTLTVDDRQLIVMMVQNILNKLDPTGTHLGAFNSEEALRLAWETPLDVVFLDVEMPGMSGIELAGKLQERYPLLNIIFITGYQEYMSSAFALYASDYILKPVTEKAVVKALGHLRYRREEITKKTIYVRCFGSFEVFHAGKPLEFHRGKTKELFAYLIDRRGATCNNDMIMGNLWPEKEVTNGLKSMLRTILSDLKKRFEELGAGEVICRANGGIYVNVNQVDCDYYRYLRGDPVAVHQFQGEYMSQYDFAEETRASLQMKIL